MINDPASIVVFGLVAFVVAGLIMALLVRVIWMIILIPLRVVWFVVTLPLRLIHGR